jgi:4,5-dihydroxyphthalate decarboxylase
MAREDAMDLGFPALRYDITLPLADGRVGIDGVTLRPAKISSMVFKDVPEMREGRFGLAELNLGYLCAAVEAGWKFVALPVFAKRKGPLGFIFCRKSAGIAAPRDLEGKRIGTRQYRTALTLWARGWLAEHYGVDTAKLRWTAQVPEVFPFAGTPPAIDYVPPEPGIVERFLAGETDVLITDISDAAAFDRLESDSGVHRLFADYAEEEARVVATAGYYAPVHVMILSRALDEADPHLPAADPHQGPGGRPGAGPGAGRGQGGDDQGPRRRQRRAHHRRGLHEQHVHGTHGQDHGARPHPRLPDHGARVRRGNDRQPCGPDRRAQ